MTKNFEDELNLLKNEEKNLNILKNNLIEIDEIDKSDFISNVNYIDTITNVDNLDFILENKTFSDLEKSCGFDNEEDKKSISDIDDNIFNYKSNLETELCKVTISGNNENLRKSMKIDVSKNIENFKKLNFDKKKEDKKFINKAAGEITSNKTPNRTTPLRTTNRTPVKGKVNQADKFSIGGKLASGGNGKMLNYGKKK